MFSKQSFERLCNATLRGVPLATRRFVDGGHLKARRDAVVPGLASEIQGELHLADTDLFMESRDWSLLDHPFRPTESEFAILGTAHSFEIDLEGARITHRFVGPVCRRPVPATLVFSNTKMSLKG